MVKAICFNTKYFKGGRHNELFTVKKEKDHCARSARNDENVKRLETNLVKVFVC